jgi:8-oxo-dGTP pyrophosphatase MutT (NUDIX family)
MNQYLKDKQYKVPDNILKRIRTTLISNPTGEGIKRAKNILNSGYLTYQSMKRLKNFFDYFNPQTGDKIQYMLAGGEHMKAFIEQTLNADRNAVKVGNDVKRDVKDNFRYELKPYDTPKQGIETINEDEKKKEKQKNAVAVIVNSDNKILLLKRGVIKNGWGNGQYGLVGGAIEKGESPEKACEREIKEETDLEINKFTKSFSIQRNVDSIEHIFACRYDGEPTDVKLNNEHTNYGWYDVNEMEFLDTVPHLIEYITLVFKKYE